MYLMFVEDEKFIRDGILYLLSKGNGLFRIGKILISADKYDLGGGGYVTKPVAQDERSEEHTSELQSPS